MDNASNNKKVQKIVGAEIDDLWCLIHTSHLAVGDLFKDYVGLVDVAKVIEKCQTLAVKSRKKIVSYLLLLKLVMLPKPSLSSLFYRMLPDGIQNMTTLSLFCV